MVHTERSAEPVAAHYRYVSSEYFPIFDVRLVDGRRFTKAEGDAGVTVISESLARRLWPDRSAVGQALQIVPDGRVPATAPIRRQTTLQVVGVTADAPVDLNAAGPDALVLQLPASVTAAGAGLVVRVSDEPQGARQAIRAALDAATPGAVQTIHKLDEFVAGRVYPFRVAYWIAGMVGALALVLTISGVYGVLSYIVAQRRRELGIRMALGADCRAVATLVLTHALRQAAVAVPIGALLALGAARVFAANVMMVDVFDGPSYAAGMLVVVGACVAASLAPAVRAMRIDPASTLRAE
jgi:hypothetical protein